MITLWIGLPWSGIFYNFQTPGGEQLCITPIKAVSHMSLATWEFSLPQLCAINLPLAVTLSRSIVILLLTDRWNWYVAYMLGSWRCRGECVWGGERSRFNPVSYYNCSHSSLLITFPPCFAWVMYHLRMTCWKFSTKHITNTALHVSLSALSAKQPTRQTLCSF